jgi:hypothetical protein
VPPAQGNDELGRVIGFVEARGEPPVAGTVGQHLRHYFALRPACGLGQLRIDQQTVLFSVSRCLA